MKQSSPSRKPRSRNNSRKPSRSSGQSSGNRTENRVRGNPKQLLDKYKTQAREARQAGDRVQAENFHQYADHYQRVLNEMRLGCGGVFEDYREIQRRDVAPDLDDDQGADEFQHDDETAVEIADEAGQMTEPERSGRRGSRSERAAQADVADQEARTRGRSPNRGRSRDRRPDGDTATDTSDLPSIIASDDAPVRASDPALEDQPSIVVEEAAPKRRRKSAKADSDSLPLDMDEPSVKPETDAA